MKHQKPKASRGGLCKANRDQTCIKTTRLILQQALNKKLAQKKTSQQVVLNLHNKSATFAKTIGDVKNKSSCHTKLKTQCRYIGRSLLNHYRSLQ